MIIKATLVTLILVLVIVVSASYYVNKEGFDDISNGYFSSLSNDLGSAINTVSSDVSSVTNATANAVSSDMSSVINGSVVPTRNDVVPQVSISGSGYNAMNLQERAELLKDIQKLVRNEVLASRSTTPVINGNTTSNTASNTDSTAQGQEYEGSCYKDTEYRCPKNSDGTCPPVPDMSEYIRKDAIPCWGCSLDY